MKNTNKKDVKQKEKVEGKIRRFKKRMKKIKES
jgi:hypothetical protein